MDTNNIKIILHKVTHKLNLVLICCLLTFASLFVSSNELDASHGLFIKPKSCVVETTNEHCEKIVEVQWKLKNSRNVCLFIEKQNRPLACWKNETFITDNFTIDIASNVNFQLRDEITNQVIYSAPFSLYLKLAKYRKKRRNPWSFY